MTSDCQAQDLYVLHCALREFCIFNYYWMVTHIPGFSSEDNFLSLLIWVSIKTHFQLKRSFFYIFMSLFKSLGELKMS